MVFQKIVDLIEEFRMVINLILSAGFAIVVSYFSNLLFRKIIKNYELYINKKHSVYLDLWPSLIEAISAVNNQRGLKRRTPLEEMNLKDFKEKITKLRLTDKQKDYWLKNFNEYQSGTKESKKLIEKSWYDLLGEIDVISALTFIENLKYKYISNQPFLSEKLDKLYELVISLLREIAIFREIPGNSPEEHKKDRLKISKNFEKIEQARKEILSSMRTELESGKYNIVGSQSKNVFEKCVFLPLAKLKKLKKLQVNL